MGDFWTTYLSSAEKMANVTLVTRDRQEQATHAVLLASVSPLMKVMLMEVKVTDESTTIILPDFSREEVELCLNSLFRGNVDGIGRSLLDTLGVTSKAVKKEEVKFKAEPPDSDREESSELTKMESEEGSDGGDWEEDKFEPALPAKVEPEKNFECSYCNKKFTTDKRLRCHVSLAHEQKPEYLQYLEEDGENWNCGLCKKSFPKRIRCVVHLQKTHKLGEKFTCEVCTKQFFNAWNLKQHLKSHNNARDNVCHLCGNGFIEKSHLKKHVIRVHGSEQEKKAKKTFVCSTCGKGFYTQCSLSEHEMTHLEHDSFFCDQCEKGYKTKNALRIHRNKIHLGMYPLKPEQRTKQNMAKIQKRADTKARNGGVLRTPEEKVKFNEYMRNYQARKREEKQQATYSGQ